MTLVLVSSVAHPAPHTPPPGLGQRAVHLALVVTTGGIGADLCMVAQVEYRRIQTTRAAKAEI